MSATNSVRKYQGNLDRLLRGSEQGISYAAWKLGNWYFEGRYVARNYATAREMYQSGVQNGCFLSMRSLAYMLIQGVGGNLDREGGLKLFEAAAKYDALCAHEAALIYYFGRGVKEDLVKAREYFSLAASKSYKPAMIHLALLDSLGVIPRSPGETLQTLIEMTDLTSGLEKAKLELAFVLFRSGDIADTQGLAETCMLSLDRAASAGLPDGLYHLGNAYLGSHFAPRNTAKAFQAFSEAAHLGHREAMVSLAELYESGETMLDGKQKAIEWLNLARKLGSPTALRKIAEKSLYQSNSCVFDVELVKMFLEAAEGGDRMAWFHLSDYADTFYSDMQKEALIDPNRVFYMAVAYGKDIGNYCAARQYLIRQSSKEDIDKGLAWLECGVDDGMLPCIEMLGRELILGKNGFPSNAEGVVLLEYAISQGSIWAASFLGYEYMAGRNAIKNLEMAKTYLEIAAASEDYVAMHSLGIMLTEGNGTSIDYERGFALLDKSQQLKKNESLEKESGKAEAAKLNSKHNIESKRQMAQVIQFKKNGSQEAS